MQINLKLRKWCSRRVIYVVLFLYICIVFHLLNTSNLQRILEFIVWIYKYTSSHTKDEGKKYVLLWEPFFIFSTLSDGNMFKGDCAINNCISTKNKDYFTDLRQFDAIIFEFEAKEKTKPNVRSSSQLYIFSTIESAYNTAVCEVINEEFFNWTFTYRLDSDIPWPYFSVQINKGKVVAPSPTVRWVRSSKPIKPAIKTILRGKKKAAAWVVSHCKTDSFRDEYLSKLQDHLYHYALKIDVFGECSKNKCPNNDCDKLIKEDYHFYMAFENSFSDDYVTEKVLHGYNNYAVPVVYGQANYSRFLPPNSYINARTMHPYNLAYIIYESIRDPKTFEQYFKWTNTYTIGTDPKVYHPMCDLCAALNSKAAKHAPAKKNFRIWWNTRNGMKWCLPQAFWNETGQANTDAKHIFTLY